MKNFTLVFLMGIMFQFSGFSQNSYGYSVKDAQVKVLRFFPNPATTFINFEFQRHFDRGYNLTIYNFVGKKVWELSNLSVSNQIDLSDFARGVFIFQLRDKNGRVIESGKFQISK